MLQVRDLDMIRCEAELTLTEQGEIWRPKETETEFGGTDQTLIKVADVPVRIDSVSSNPEERIIAEKITDSTPYVVVYPIRYLVMAGNVIKVGTRSFTVVGTANRRTNSVLYRAVCKEIL